MTNIAENDFIGIIQPLKPYLFRVTFSDEQNNNYSLLSMQMLNVKTKSTRSPLLGITTGNLIVEMDATEGIGKPLKKLMNNEFNVLVETLSKDGKAVSPIERFTKCSVSNLKMGIRDYSNDANEFVKVKLEIDSERYEIE